MAVGLPLKTTYADGDVYSASDVNDTNGTINTTAAPYAAGKNKILNSDYSIWQRGTSFTTPSYAYTADRWTMDAATAFATSITVSRQTFTPGTAPVAGYEGQYFFRLVYTKAALQTGQFVKQRIEDVRTLAGQTATISFWAKCDAARSIGVAFDQNFGSGGSGTVSTSAGTASATTAWQRFSYTVSIPSISGKTIGTSSFLELVFTLPNASSTTDIWGVQLENNSTATAFQTATGTIQGELAACQRYYYRQTGPYIFSNFGSGYGTSATSAFFQVVPPVTMRLATSPTVDFSTLAAYDGTTVVALTNLVLTGSQNGQNCLTFTGTAASGLTNFRPVFLIANNSASAFVGLSQEL
jgi:hypothetical protein